MELNHNVVGFLVDAVSEVLRIPESTVEPAPAVVAGIGSEYIEGVGRLDDRLLILLDLEALLGRGCSGGAAESRSVRLREHFQGENALILRHKGE